MQLKVLNNRYELEQKIGEGGMARVYRGRDGRLNRRVAVKVLHPHHASDVGFLQRFHHEAQAAANLHHPNIVDVYDVGQDDGVHYIVMEYVEGSDLKSLILRNGALPPEQAVPIAIAVAEGLEAAHRLGMVHRDVKPQNIIVGPAGQVKITDFGIAKSSLSTAMTETGVTFGTADYISPEQAQGLQATARSDVYSLGVTLYEMLTGRLPFTGDSSVAVAMQHVSSEPPPPRMLNARIPLQLEALVLRALAKRPEERPASAREFARLLRSYQTVGEQETLVRPVAQHPAQRPSPRPAANGGAVSRGATGPMPRAPLPPPRPAVAAPAPTTGAGRDFGVFLLGLLLLGVILVVVYILATVPFGDLFGSASGRPRPTEAPAATDVAATPSPTPELITVPDLVGLDERAAISQLEQLGLQPFAELPRYTDTPTYTVTTPGQVFDQMPRAGQQVTATTTVTYVVSLGPALVSVPDVVTMRGVDAAFQLRNLGLQVEEIEAPDRLSAGFVFRMEPGAGVRLPRGETVTIFVSVGDKVRMPDVVGLDESEARRQIENAGLFVSFADQQSCDRLPADVCASSQPGEVVSATVAAGELVDRGTGVTIGVRAP
jgi:eukaryotic-like serine/threonine-protein kinase